MTGFKKFLQAFSAAVVLYGAPALADGLFRPSLYEITVYEAGLQNSQTGERSPIFKNDSGVTIDLANPGTWNLVYGASLKTGSWDQIYSITSNTQSYAGNDGNGCFIRQGSATYPNPENNNPMLATNNPGLAGTRRVTFNSFAPTAPELGPMSSPSTADADGRPISNQRAWLVSSSNPVPNGGGTINRILYLGNLASSITTPMETVDIRSTYDLRNSFLITGGCAIFNVDNVKFTITY